MEALKITRKEQVKKSNENKRLNLSINVIRLMKVLFPWNQLMSRFQAINPKD